MWGITLAYIIILDAYSPYLFGCPLSDLSCLLTQLTHDNDEAHAINK